MVLEKDKNHRKTACNVWVPRTHDDRNYSQNWDDVDCLECLLHHPDYDRSYLPAPSRPDRRPKTKADRHKLAGFRFVDGLRGPELAGLTLCGEICEGHELAFPEEMPDDECFHHCSNIHAQDSWTRVDCQDCLAKYPASVHIVSIPDKVQWHGGTPLSRFNARSQPLSPATATQTLCGQVAAATDTTAREGYATCLDCLDTVKKTDRVHKRKPGAKGNEALCGLKLKSVHFRTSDTWLRVSCVDCIVAGQVEPIPELIENAAGVVVHNALAQARHDGLELVTGTCDYCKMRDDGTVCVQCATLLFHGAVRTDVDGEHTMAEHLGVPIPWVIDFITGYDGDGKAQRYPTAFAAGKKLARKHKPRKGA